MGVHTRNIYTIPTFCDTIGWAMEPIYSSPCRNAHWWRTIEMKLSATSCKICQLNVNSPCTYWKWQLNLGTALTRQRDQNYENIAIAPRFPLHRIPRLHWKSVQTDDAVWVAFFPMQAAHNLAESRKGLPNYEELQSVPEFQACEQANFKNTLQPFITINACMETFPALI